MATALDVLNSAFRDHEVFGSPATGPHEVDKAEARLGFSILANAIQALTLAGVIATSKTTKALLDADLAYPAGALGLVHSDTTTTNNGLYRKNGASGSGSWTLVFEFNPALSASISLLQADVTALGGRVTAIEPKVASLVVTTEDGFGLSDDFGASPFFVYRDGVAIWPWLEAKLSAIAAGTQTLPKVYVAGDSRADRSSDPAPNRTTTVGWLYWLQLMTGARFDFSLTDSIAVGGDNSEQMVTRLAALEGKPPGIVICLCSTNDRSASWSYDRSIAALSQWQATVLAWGHKIIWIAELPRGDDNVGSSFTPLSKANADIHQRVRRWFLAQAAKPKIFVADAWTDVADLLSTVGKAKNDQFLDGIHPGVPCAYSVAASLGPVINALLPPRPRLIGSLVDLWSAENPKGALNPNPLLTGTGGTKGGGTGDLADNCTAVLGAGLSAVFSKETDDTGAPVQKVVVSGTPTGTGYDFLPNSPSVQSNPNPVSVVISQAITASRLTEGAIVEAFASISVDAGSTNLRGVSVWFEYTAGGVAYRLYAGEPKVTRDQPNVDMPTVAWGGVAAVPPTDPLPAGVTAAAVGVTISGVNFASGDPKPLSATVRFSRLSANITI